ncbi:hypothetical protein IWX49DRAFT_53147 [Phyllosticta citricarpa]
MAGIEHLIFISIIGPGRYSPSATVARESKAIEHRLQSEALHWTILRDSQYSEDISDAAGPRALDMRMCVCNIGEGRVGLVCREDSTACAAAVLKDPKLHRQRIYHLTRSELLSIREVLDLIEDLEGLESGAISYQKVSALADFWSHSAFHAKEICPGLNTAVFSTLQAWSHLAERAGWERRP